MEIKLEKERQSNSINSTERRWETSMERTSSNSEPATLSIISTAAYLGVSVPTARNVINREDFYPRIKLGKRVLIVRSLLDQWLEEQGGSEVTFN